MVDVYTAVKEIIGEIFEDSVEIKRDMQLSEIGFDSFQFIRFCVEAEEKLQVRIPDDKLDISEFVNLSEIIEMLEELAE